MTHDLIPKDELTRRQLAKILAAMIREDFKKLKAAAGSDPEKGNVPVAADGIRPAEQDAHGG